MYLTRNEKNANSTDNKVYPTISKFKSNVKNLFFVYLPEAFNKARTKTTMHVLSMAVSIFFVNACEDTNSFSCYSFKKKINQV